MTDLDEPRQVSAEPRSALAARNVTGHQVLLITIDEDLGTAKYTYGYRAVSDVITGPDGRRTVQVTPDSTRPTRANSVTWPAELVLVTCAPGCACQS
ncbi:hypothetical protein ACWDWO_21685 [Actinopolymorpha singaporensis]